MDVALVLDQVEDRAFDPSQGSAHDGLSADANLGSLIGRRHRQPDRFLHDARRLKRYYSVVRRMRAEILRSFQQSVQNGQLFRMRRTYWQLRTVARFRSPAVLCLLPPAADIRS